MPRHTLKDSRDWGENMDSSGALGYIVYAGLAYASAYLIYMLVRSINSAGAVLKATPYDAERLILRRKYV